MIRGVDLQVRFGDVTALDLASIEVAAGARLACRGPNGSGKSTLLRALAGLQPLTRGTLTGVPPRGRAVLVHQRPYFFRGTAHDNVCYALRISGRPLDEADALLNRLGATHLATRVAAKLSGGERRRIAIARALAASPELLLLDEPFAALDEAGQADVRRALEDYEGTLLIAEPEAGPLSITGVIALES